MEHTIGTRTTEPAGVRPPGGWEGVDDRTASSERLVLAWLVAGLVVIGWGVNFVLAKHALNQIDVGPFNFIRFASMTALGWIIVGMTKGLRPVPVSDRPRLAAAAIVGFCGYVFGFSVGLSFTSAFSASLLLALVPLWVLLISAVVQRRLPSARSVLAVAVAGAGTALFVGSRTSVSLGWGDLVSLIVAGCYASYLLLNRPLVARYPPFTLTTYAITVAAVPILLLTAPTLASQDWGAVTAAGAAAMVWVVVGPVLVAWSVWNWVLKRLSPSQVAPLLFAVPVVSGLTSWLVLDEQIVLGQVVGTAAVIAGLALNRQEPPAGRERPSEPVRRRQPSIGSVWNSSRSAS